MGSEDQWTQQIAAMDASPGRASSFAHTVQQQYPDMHLPYNAQDWIAASRGFQSTTNIDPYHYSLTNFDNFQPQRDASQTSSNEAKSATDRTFQDNYYQSSSAPTEAAAPDRGLDEFLYDTESLPVAAKLTRIFGESGSPSTSEESSNKE